MVARCLSANTLLSTGRVWYKCLQKENAEVRLYSNIAIAQTVSWHLFASPGIPWTNINQPDFPPSILCFFIILFMICDRGSIKRFSDGFIPTPDPASIPSSAGMIHQFPVDYTANPSFNLFIYERIYYQSAWYLFGTLPHRLLQR